jgi:hypothetical protein
VVLFNFWRFSCSNKGTSTQFRARARRRALRAPALCLPRHPRRRACRGHASSKAAPSPGPRALRRLEVRVPRASPSFAPCHAPPRRSRRAVHRCDRWSVHGSLPCAHAYRDRHSTTTGSCVIHSSQASERPYLNGRPFLAHAHVVPPTIRAARGAAHPQASAACTHRSESSSETSPRSTTSPQAPPCRALPCTALAFRQRQTCRLCIAAGARRWAFRPNPGHKLA